MTFAFPHALVVILTRCHTLDYTFKETYFALL